MLQNRLGPRVLADLFEHRADRQPGQVGGPFAERLLQTADGVVAAYQVRITIKGEAVGKMLKEVKLSPNWIVAAIRRGERSWVPGAQDALEIGDTALLIGKHGMEKQLQKLFTGG